ncbi:MAG TPA: hypothetical protein VLK27_10315 [Chthoniobacterales bacterium]|nr:hypothetical protein [Chthoniobacterales bacterium]
MKRIVHVLAIAAAVAWPLLVSSKDSRSGHLRSRPNQTAAPTVIQATAGSSSADYSVLSQSIDSGGGPAQSASYAVYASAIGEFDAASSASIASANYSDEIGYVGQLSGLEGPITAASRKTHGTAGAFDIGLPLSGPVGIECRPGGASGDFTLVVTFAESVTIGSASVASGIGDVPQGGTSANGNQISINLTGVANAQYLTVSLNSVSDSQNNTVEVLVPLAVLLGDTTANGKVNSSDVAQTQSQSGKLVTLSNFREDVTLNGGINSSDIALVQSQSGTALPSQ